MRSSTRLVLAIRPEDRRAVPSRDELPAGVALVGDDRLSAVQPDREQSERDLAFFLVGGREDRRPGCPVGGGEQVQAHPPEPARMGVGAPIAARVSQLRASRGLDRAAALNRGGVDQHHAIGVSWAVGGEHADQPLDQIAATLPALPIPGLLREPGEQMPQLLGRDRQKLSIVVDTHHLLRHREHDDPPGPSQSPVISALHRQEVIRGRENRNGEQIEVGVQLGPSFGSGGWHFLSTADFDCSPSNSYSTTAEVVESII